MRSVAGVLLVISSLCACSNDTSPGAVKVLASFQQSAGTVERVTVTATPQSGQPITRDLTLNQGAWEVTLFDLASGSWSFEADAFLAGSTSADFTGTTSGITVVAGQTEQVNIVLHATGPGIHTQGPVINGVFASTSTPSEGAAVSLSVSASGTDPLTYTWTSQAGSFSTDGAVLTASGVSTIWYAPQKTGTQPLSITVTDANGNQASLDFSLTVVLAGGAADVQVFLPPTIESLTAVQQDAQTWALSLAVAQPDDGDQLTYSWSLAGGCPEGGTFSDSSQQDPLWIFTGPGVCTLTVTVTDPVSLLGDGPYPYATASIQLDNSVRFVEYGPAITLASQSVAAASAGDTVHFSAHAEDGNTPGQDLTWTWSASDGSLGDAFTSGGASSTSTVDWSAPDCIHAGGSTITAQVSNGQLSATQIFTVLPGDGGACSGQGTQGNPGASCAALLASGATQSGIYWVNPAGVPAFPVYCDQVTDGGGWALAATLGFGFEGILDAPPATASLPAPGTPGLKLSDDQINALISASSALNAARLACGVDGAFATRYFRSSCPFHANVEVLSQDCFGGASAPDASDYSGFAPDTHAHEYGYSGSAYGNAPYKIVYWVGIFNNCAGPDDSTSQSNSGSLMIR